MQNRNQPIPAPTNQTSVQDASIGHDIAAQNRNTLHIEDKVAHLSLQVNQIIIRPYLQQALDYLKVSRRDAELAYNALSDEIAQEVKMIQGHIKDLTAKIKEAKIVIDKTQQTIRNKYNNATEEEISSGALNLDNEYNFVAEEYENTMRWAQELTKYRMRIESLIETQNILDNSIISRTSEIQVEIDNLDLLLHNFDSSNYSDVFASRKGLRNAAPVRPATPVVTRRGEQLNEIVDTMSMKTYEEIANIKREDTQPMRQAVNPVMQRAPVQQPQPQPVAVQQPQPTYVPQTRPAYATQPQQPTYTEYSSTLDVPYIEDVVKSSTNGKVFVVRKSNPITKQDAQALKSNAIDPSNIQVIR